MIPSAVPNNGVPLDPDQGALAECNFSDCRKSANDEPLIGIVYKGALRAVCGKCFRTRVLLGAPVR